MLSHGKATASVRILLVCPVCLVTPLDSKLGKPRHVLRMFALKPGDMIILILPIFFGSTD